MPSAKSKCPKCKHTNNVRLPFGWWCHTPAAELLVLALLSLTPPFTHHIDLLPRYFFQISLVSALIDSQEGWNFCSNCAYKNTAAQASCAYHFVVMGAGGVGKSAVTIQVRDIGAK